MTEIIETHRTNSFIPTHTDNGETVISTTRAANATNSETTEYIIYFIFGVVEALLALRLLLKLAGASLTSSFVGLIYGITGIFIAPFEGIFRRAFTAGIETTSVLEPSTIVAMVIYSILALGIVKLVRIYSGKQQSSI